MTSLTISGTNGSAATAPGTDGTRNQRLHTAANQFEAMLLQEMLKPLAAKTDGEGGSDDDGKGQSSPLQGFGIQAVAESLARSGALGFAKQIEGALSAHASATAAAK